MICVCVLGDTVPGATGTNVYSPLDSYPSKIKIPKSYLLKHGFYLGLLTGMGEDLLMGAAVTLRKPHHQSPLRHG